MKKVFFMIFVCCLFGILNPTFALKSEHKPNFMQEQMILMGVYVYGINQELSENIPDLEELRFLSDSLEGVVLQIQKTKQSQMFHKDMSDFLKEVRALKKISKDRKHTEVSNQARVVLNACAKCHRKGSL